MKRIELDAARPVWQKILDIDSNTVQPVSESYVPMAELSPLIRTALKRFGLSNRQVSVRYSRGDYAVCVQVVNADTTGLEGDAFWNAYHERQDAVNYLRALMRSLFPANEPRYGEGGVYSDNYYVSYVVS
jgi:hypothetical protein